METSVCEFVRMRVSARAKFGMDVDQLADKSTMCISPPIVSVLDNVLYVKKLF